MLEFLLALVAAASLAPVAFWWCCCSCPSFSDTFNRSDDTDIGANWTEVSGDWSISSNQLATSSTNALAISTLTVDAGGGRVQVKVPIEGTNGRRYVLRVIGAYTDTNNYIFVEARFDPFGASQGVWLYERIAGSDFLLDEKITSAYTPSILSATMTILLCWNGTNASAGFAYGSVNTVLTGDCTVTGTKAGLGTGASVSGVLFDDFSFTGNNVTNGSCLVCHSCRDYCSDGHPPGVEVTLPSKFTNQGCADCAAEFNGQTFALDPVDELILIPPIVGLQGVMRPCQFLYAGTFCSGRNYWVMCWVDWNNITLGNYTVMVRVMIDGTIDGPTSIMEYQATSETAPRSCSGHTWNCDWVNGKNFDAFHSCGYTFSGSPSGGTATVAA